MLNELEMTRARKGRGISCAYVLRSIRQKMGRLWDYISDEVTGVLRVDCRNAK